MDFAWDAEAYDKWKKEEDVRFRVAMSMMQELIPPNFIDMSEDVRKKYFQKNWDKVNSAMERVRKRTRYAGP